MVEELEPGTENQKPRSTSFRFIKVSRRPDADERIRREAAILESVRHAGIVRFIAADTAAFPSVLITERVEGHSLAEAGPVPTAKIDRVVEAVGATLADLHALGVVHGAIAPEHILVRPDGQPVLCSFGYGGRIGEPAPALPPALAKFALPERATAPLSPAFDLYALREVRRSLTEAAPRAATPVVVGQPPAPGSSVPGRRPPAPLVVGAVGGAALLAALGIWGLTRRTGPARPGFGAAVTSTSPAPSTTGNRPGPLPPQADVDPGATSAAASPPPPAGKGPSTAHGVDSRDGAALGGRIGEPRVDLANASARSGGAPSTDDPVRELSADGEPPCPPAMPAGAITSTPLAGATLAPAPVAGSAKARSSSTSQPSSAPAPTEHSVPAAPPAGATSLPSPSIPGPAALAPAVAMPPPGSLPPDVTLPDPATLAPPVSLPEESTLVPRTSPVP